MQRRIHWKSCIYKSQIGAKKKKNRYKGQGQIITPSKSYFLFILHYNVYPLDFKLVLVLVYISSYNARFMNFLLIRESANKKSIIWQYRYVLLSTLCFLIINSLIRSESQATKNLPARQNSFSWLMSFRKSIFFLDLFFFHTLKIIHWFLSINFHPLLKNIKLTSLIKIHTNFKTD